MRKLWIALAESEKELGLDITDKQIAQMKEHIYDINYDVAKAREKGSSSRCNVTRLRIWFTVSGRKAYYSLGCNKLLCR